MDIHIRSKKTQRWSYASTAVVRIGAESLEVSGAHDGNSYWINKEEGIASPKEDGEAIIFTFAGYPVSFRRLGPLKQREFIIDLGNNESILIMTWRDFVRVDVNGKLYENFGGSGGLMGSFPDGKFVARDNKTVINRINKFGQEWQVLVNEPKLFHSNEGPQAPSICEIPTKFALRRRLAESPLSKEEAEAACFNLPEDDRESCVFDVLAIGDINAVASYKIA